jgi:hypothetical protein
MTFLHRLASVLAWLFHRKRAEQALDDELQAFIDISAAEKVRDGLPPEEARRLAMLELGGLEQAKERVRTYRHGGSLDEVGRDVVCLPHVRQESWLHYRHCVDPRAGYRGQYGYLQLD